MAETNNDRVIQHVRQLVESGRVGEARELVRQLLLRNPNDANAWRLMAELVDNPDMAADCYEQILRINPVDEAARDALEQLRAGKKAPDYGQLLSDALLLHQRGRPEEANELVKEILRRDPDNIEAWGVMARLSDEPEEIVDCLEQILRIDPENETTQAQLERIQEIVAQSEERARRRAAALPFVVLMLILAALAVVFIVFGLPLLRPAASPTPPPTEWASRSGASREMTCEGLIERATQSASACRQIQAGQVCYGNDPLGVTLVPETLSPFQAHGDTIPANQLQVIQAAPMSLDAEEWGVAMFALPVTLPEALPDDEIVFTLFGDVRVENDSGDLQSFTFSSAPEPITCVLIPYPGLLVNAAANRGVTFQANGAAITAQGAMHLRAAPDATMTVTMMDGNGIVEASDASLELEPGEMVAVPLGGEDGLQAVGPPSGPMESDFVLAGTSCRLLGVGCASVSAGATETPTSTPTRTPTPETPQPTEQQPTVTQILTPRSTMMPRPTNTPMLTSPPAATSPPPTNTYTPSITPTFTATYTEIPVPVPIEPNGSITTDQPIFRWIQSGGLTQYLLWVYGDAGFDEQWWGEANCSGGECSISSPWTLSPDIYHWQVVPAGSTTWSITRDFTVTP